MQTEQEKALEAFERAKTIEVYTEDENIYRVMSAFENRTVFARALQGSHTLPDTVSVYLSFEGIVLFSEQLITDETVAEWKRLKIAAFASLEDDGGVSDGIAEVLDVPL